MNSYKLGRRLACALAAAILMTLLATPAPRARAETEMTFDAIHAKVVIPQQYHVLTPETLESQTAWLEGRGLDVDELALDFKARGVLLRGYDDANDRVLEITAIQDVDAQSTFDVDQQTAAWRAEYRKGHLSGADWGILGYAYDSAEWKKTTQYGRFLMLKYKLREGGQIVRRGYQRRTIRNGYTVTLDIQVTGRTLKSADDRAMNEVINTWVFEQSLEMPPMPVKLTFTSPPPGETNTDTFKVRGESNPRAQITALVLNEGTGDTKTYTDTAGSNGVFNFDVTLQAEGAYTMVVLAQATDEIDTEQTFTLLYQKTILPVNFTSPIPASLSGDTITIAGTSVYGATVQLIVNDKATTKRVGSNRAFSFKADVSAEGSYDIVVLFTKKGLVERRYSATLTRTWSDAERYEKTVAAAVKPSYSNLTKKLSGYMGRVLTYAGYVTEVIHAGDEWLIVTALTQTKGVYKNILVVSTDKEPLYTAGEMFRFYGRLDGTHVVYDDEGKMKAEYPYFAALYLEPAE